MNSFLAALESIDNFARQPTGIMLTTGFLISISLTVFQLTNHGDRLGRLETIKEISAREIEEMKISHEVMKKGIDYIKEDIVEMKGEIKEMKVEIKEMKEDITEMKMDIAEIKTILINMNTKKP